MPELTPTVPVHLSLSITVTGGTTNPPPRPDDILCPGNLQDAIRYHETQHPYSKVPPVPTLPSHEMPSATSDCPTCLEYQKLAADVVAELHGILAFAKANETSAMNRWETDMRRAQALHVLHEAVLLKELSTPQSETSTSGTTVPSASASASAPTIIDNVPVNRRSRRAFNTAIAELDQLKALPLASHKWTWGPELLATEVRELIPLPGQRQRLHSGYNLSLPEGAYRH